MRLIELESCPLSLVKSKEFRHLNRYRTKISVETVIKMFELVELWVKNKIENLKGAMLFDEWSRRGAQYVAMVASYIEEVSVKKRDTITTEKMQRLALITLSSLAKVPDSGISVSTSERPEP